MMCDLVALLFHDFDYWCDLAVCAAAGDSATESIL